MKSSTWVQRSKQFIQRLAPGYHGAGSLTVGAERRGYGARTHWYAKLVAAMSALSIAVVLPTWWFVSGFDSQQYQEQLRIALAKEDYAAAKVPLETLLKNSPENLDYRWCHAAIEERLGRSNAAITTRAELARQGYGPAMLWLADRDYPLEDFASWSDEQHSGFVSLLSDTSNCSINSRIELNKRLAAYRTQQGDLTSAIEVLREIAPWCPVAHVNVAALHLQLGDALQAQASAKQAREALQARIKKHPRDVDGRLQLVRALMMLDCESDALQSLADGLDITGQPVMRQAAGEVLVHWARRLEQTEGREPTFWPRLQLIHRSTQCAPQDSLVLNATLDLIDECRGQEEQRIAELRFATVQGIERVVAHTMLGWLLCVTLQPERSLQHARLATMDAPEVPTVLNNLALVMLDRPDFAPEQAEAMIDLALILLPNQPQFLETRTKIAAQRRAISFDP